MPTQWYRNLTPEHRVYACTGCKHCFHEDDYELMMLGGGICRFCRTPLAEEGGS